MRLRIVTSLAAILIATSAANAQQAALSVGDAVDRALRNYPSIKVSQEQVNSAAAGIDLARTAYLPRVDSMLQVNRATRNNIFGLLLPQSVIPSISGPVLGTGGAESVWGSAAGTLVTWEPFDFGQRSASVSAAEAAKARSNATLLRTEFEVEVATADAFLTLAAAGETQRAAQAGVDRAEVLVRSVRAQVDAQLRPGADASRAEAELAVARSQLARAAQAVDISRAILAQFVGIEPRDITLASAKFQDLPMDTSAPALNTARHPASVEQDALVEQKKSELQSLEKSYVPRFLAQGSAFARGTGAEVNGDRLGGFNGLAPNTPNYAVGFSVTFPLFDLPSIHAREAAQSAVIRAESARSRQISSDLTARWNEAVATLDGSRRIAANTPVQVTAAGDASRQATARYEAGLGTIVEVADAQRLLTQAQIDDSLARLSVWRALLGVASASGDIQPFLTSARP